MREKEKPGEWLKRVKPTYQEFYTKFCESIDIIDGKPVFMGTPNTFYGLAQSWTGPIIINEVTYKVKFMYRKWFVLDIDKRLLPDDVHLEILRLYKEYLAAVDTEKELRKSFARDRDRASDEEYYVVNKKMILEKKKKKDRRMRIQGQVQATEVYELIVQGKTKHQIKEYLREKYNYTDRRIDQVIAAAGKIIKDESVEDREQLREQHHTQLRSLYEKALANDDIKECRLILETLNKLYGLNEIQTQKVEIDKVVRFKFDTKLNSGQQIQLDAQEAELAEQQMLGEGKEEIDMTSFEDEKIRIEQIKKDNNAEEKS